LSPTTNAGCCTSNTPSLSGWKMAWSWPSPERGFAARIAFPRPSRNCRTRRAPDAAPSRPRATDRHYKCACDDTREPRAQRVVGAQRRALYGAAPSAHNVGTRWPRHAARDPVRNVMANQTYYRRRIRAGSSGKRWPSIGAGVVHTGGAYGPGISVHNDSGNGRCSPWHERPPWPRVGPLVARRTGVVHATPSVAATVAADTSGIERRPLRGPATACTHHYNRFAANRHPGRRDTDARRWVNRWAVRGDNLTAL
jgi:hypothetical protein